jgi:hypothetical protein
MHSRGASSMDHLSVKARVLCMWISTVMYLWVGTRGGSCLGPELDIVTTSWSNSVALTVL